MSIKVRIALQEERTKECNEQKEANGYRTSGYFAVNRQRVPDSLDAIPETHMEWLSQHAAYRHSIHLLIVPALLLIWRIGRGSRDVAFCLFRRWRPLWRKGLLHIYALLSTRTRGSSTAYNRSARKLAPSTPRAMNRKAAWIRG